MKKTIYRICLLIFEITLPIFVIMGGVLVFTQLAGAVAGNGALVLGVNKALKLYVTWTACVCAFSAFIISYVRDKKTQKSGEEE